MLEQIVLSQPFTENQSMQISAYFPELRRMRRLMRINQDVHGKQTQAKFLQIVLIPHLDKIDRYL
jgi:hypothetical protein